MDRQVDSLQTSKKFKKTEIGDIPVDWEVVNLGNVANINMGQSPPSSNYFDYENGLPFFQGKTEFGEKYPTIKKWCNSPTKIAEKGDILISVRAPVGDVNIAPARCCIGRGLAAIRGTQADNIFLFFLMRYYKKTLVQVGQGGTFEAINRDVLYKLLIPFPSFPEQKKIAEILTAVDNTIEKSDVVIEKTKQLKKGLMQELLNRGIGHKKFKKTEIGDIPVDWEVVELSKVVHSYMHGIWGDEPITIANTYPVIRSTEISYDGKINFSDVALRKIPDNKLEKYELHNNDILLVASSGSPQLLGRAALFIKPFDGRKYLFTNFMTRIRASKIDPIFLFQYLNSRPYYNFLSFLQQTSTGLRNLPKTEFLKMHLPFPPLPEQEKIAKILITVDDEIKKAVENREKLVTIKKGLMQVLLTGRVRVEV